MDETMHDPSACHDCADATIAALRAELATAHQRIEAFAGDNAIRDEALKAAHLARETATRELAARTEERNRLLDEMRGRDALVVDLAAQRDARTKELGLARNYMGGLLGYIENDLERVDSALELLSISDPGVLLDEAQAFVCAP